MSDKTDFQLVAKELVDEFSTGEHILRHVIDSTYDDDTGVTTVTYEDHPMPMARYGIQKEHVTKEITTSTHFTAVMAGYYLGGLQPVRGDLIVTPAGSSFKIDDAASDQYEAAFFAFAYKEAFVMSANEKWVT